MHIVSRYVPSNFAPLNGWRPRTHDASGLEYEGDPGPHDPRDIAALDPTICPQRKAPGGGLRNTPAALMPHPPEGMDRHVWSLNHLNRRLATLGSGARNLEKCISYLDLPEDDLHRVMGFYADWEGIGTLMGQKHYIADIWSRGGLNTFRYAVWDNGIHTFPATFGRLIWDFFRQFRRDSATGRIAAGAYIP